MSLTDPLLRLLARFGEEGVEYMYWLGGQAVRLNGLLRTKTSVREKDILDRRMLERIKSGLGAED